MQIVGFPMRRLICSRPIWSMKRTKCHHFCEHQSIGFADMAIFTFCCKLLEEQLHENLHLKHVYMFVIQCICHFLSATLTIKRFFFFFVFVLCTSQVFCIYVETELPLSVHYTGLPAELGLSHCHTCGQYRAQTHTRHSGEMIE